MGLVEDGIDGRVIAKFDLKGKHLMRTRSLEGLYHVDDLREAIRKICADFPREILLNNFTATLYDQKIMPKNSLMEIKRDINLPIIYEGGIKTLGDVERLFDAGVDRVALNSVLFDKFSLLEELLASFGSQAILVNVNARKIDGEYRVFSHMGRELQQLTLPAWLKRLSHYDNVEIILTDIEAEGTGRGFSEDLLVQAASYFPEQLTIACGGMESFEQIQKTIAIGNVAGAISATYFRGML